MNQSIPAELNPADIAAIIFDFGDTLAMLSPSREELFARAARTVGLELDNAAIKRAYETVDFHHKYSSVHVKDRESFYQNYNQHLAAALGISR
jgi:FMN phosphatase YigB (HAD superfamily)